MALQIISGPGKWDLMLALLASTSSAPRTVVFTLLESDNDRLGTRPKTQAVYINGVEREDGSGESWNLTGQQVNGKPFKAYYRTNARTGCFTLLQ